MDSWLENARLIVDSAAAVVPPDGDLSRVRGLRFTPPGYARAVFAEIGAMGWLQLSLPEEAGGSGLGLRESASLLVALGRGLVPEPVVGALLAQRLLAGRCEGPLLDGTAVVVAAWQDATDQLAFAAPAATDATMAGTKRHVAGGAGADWFAVLSDRGVALVAADAPGVTRETVALHDGGFDASVHFGDVAVTWLPVDDAALALDEAILGQSAYLLGVAERGIEMTLDYLRIRKQFGKPIGSFQALQHRASELAIQQELCRAGLFATAARIDAGLAAERRAAAVSRVKSRAASLALAMAREAVQMHGAIGTTDEADIGLVVRKAMAEANRFGSARLHRARHFDASERSAA